MSLIAPVPSAAVSEERTLAIPVERARRVLPPLVATALGGAVREREDGTFVVSVGSEEERRFEMVVILQRDEAETHCLVRLDTPFASSPVSLEADRIRRQVRSLVIKVKVGLAMAALYVALVILFVVFRRSIPPQLVFPFVASPPLLVFVIPNVVARLLSRRGDRLLAKKRAHIDAEADARRLLVARAIGAIEAHLSDGGERRGYRVAPYELLTPTREEEELEDGIVRRAAR